MRELSPCLDGGDDDRLRALVVDRDAADGAGSSSDDLLRRGLAWLRIPLPGWGDAVQLPGHWKGMRVVNRRFVDACHRASIAVHVWTVNEPDRLEHLFDFASMP